MDVRTVQKLAGHCIEITWRVHGLWIFTLGAVRSTAAS
jgi:hypothetical protein